MLYCHFGWFVSCNYVQCFMLKVVQINLAPWFLMTNDFNKNTICYKVLSFHVNHNKIKY